MRFIGVYVASLALTLALPTPQTGKLVPREGDLEAAIYDEAIAGIAGDPYISDALENSDGTANAGIAADEDPADVLDVLNDDNLLANNADVLVDPAAEVLLDDTNDPAYQQDLQASYADDLLPLDTAAYEDQTTPDALIPVPDAVPLDNSEYLATSPEVDVSEVPPIPEKISKPVEAYNDLPPAVPVPPTTAEYLAAQPLQPVAPAYNAPPLLPTVPVDVQPVPQAPAVPVSNYGYTFDASTLAPNPPAYESVDLSAAPLPMGAQADTLPPAAAPEQDIDIQSQTGAVKDTAAEDSAPFNPLDDLFQGLSEGLGSLLSGLNGISGSSEKLPADDPYPVAQPVFAV
ncbi:hypothetical protein IWW42_005762 [Coemansia sp. RSA 1085]|nr:hypothetical protein LPJ68_005531 [Coemansia sp. RSA 1086]KAJ2646320.1 hypothetical protein IWW40_005498 [Coemansia sp. RSA 1250]KAJ2667671.1 hypothetical protein IWW42_005762 [Coemansia sp. RSA 1085]